MSQLPDFNAKLTAELRQHLALIGMEALVTVSVRLKPIPYEGRPQNLSRRDAREWLQRQSEAQQAPVMEALERERLQTPTVRFWSHYLANRIGAAAPRRTIEMLAALDSVQEISLLTEGDNAFRY